MSLPAQNYSILGPEVILHVSRHNHALQSAYEALLNAIREILLSQESIAQQLDDFRPGIFEFRLKVIQELQKTPEFDLMYALDEAQDFLEKLASHPDLGVISENILFALRWNRRVASAFMHSREGSLTDMLSADLPKMNYRQFISVLAMSMKEHVAQRFIDWMNASLSIEFGAMSMMVVSDEKLQVSEETLSQLASLTAKAGQDYAALAIEMGVFSTRRSGKSYVLPEFDESFINQQQSLADQGLDDYAANLDDDESKV